MVNSGGVKQKTGALSNLVSVWWSIMKRMRVRPHSDRGVGRVLLPSVVPRWMIIRGVADRKRWLLLIETSRRIC